MGLTGRLDTIQATILLEKLKNFRKEQNLRRKIAKIYNRALMNNKFVKTQKITELSKSTYSVFSLEYINEKIKKIVVRKLIANNINFNIYYKKPMHLEKVFSQLKYKKNTFPVAENLSRNILCIPIDPYLKRSEINKIVKVINYEK